MTQICFILNRSLPEIVVIIISNLYKLINGSQVNKLSLNISKTNYMLFGNSAKKFDNPNPRLDITTNGIVIEPTNKTKFLDDRLSGEESHINYVCGKLCKIVGLLLRARANLCTSALLTLYNSLVLPYFTYGIIYGAYPTLKKCYQNYYTSKEKNAHNYVLVLQGTHTQTII